MINMDKINKECSELGDNTFFSFVSASILRMATIFIVALSSCVSITPTLDLNYKYQRDLKIKIEYWSGKDWHRGETFDGFGVAQKSEKYKITVYTKGKVDLLTGKTCHREWKDENPKKEWFNSGRTFIYEPTDIEKNKLCPLDIGIYEKSQGRHGWAFIDFINDEKLPAEVSCNGEKKYKIGASVCQSKIGLEQLIKFGTEVIYESTGCKIVTENNKDFKFIMEPGDCIIYFGDKDKNIHRLILYGYDKIPIRGL